VLLKFAVAVRAALIVRVQVVLVPLQLPDQFVNVYPVPGVAVSVTDVPELYDWLQSEPQLMPVGLEVTVPEPDRPTVSV
jgi:hypothetical protein